MQEVGAGGPAGMQAGQVRPGMVAGRVAGGNQFALNEKAEKGIIVAQRAETLIALLILPAGFGAGLSAPSGPPRALAACSVSICASRDSACRSGLAKL